MKLKRKYSILVISFLIVTSFRFPPAPFQQGDIKVEGQVLYNYNDPLYQGLRVEGKIFENGKFYKSFKCDDKGRFSTGIDINHDYRFKFSMDYHGTTIVSVNTELPAEKSTGDVGGIFRFKCEIFERVEGLNMYILKKPLIKIRYVAEKDEFEPDKAWTESFLNELENFREALATYKERGKNVLKDPPAKKQVVKPKPQPTEIASNEPEKKPVKKGNTSGHRNIMDNLEEDEAETEEVDQELVEEDSITKGEIAELEEEENEEAEAAKMAVPASRMPTIRVQPRRQKIEGNTGITESEKNELRARAYEKVEIKERELAEKRFSNSVLLAREKEQQLNNKQIQSLRLRGIITTVAVEEKKGKAFDYAKNPVLEFEVLPEIRKSEVDGIFIDIEHLLLVFPTKKVRFKKETYFFGFNYYYKNGAEITAEVYCSEIESLTKQPELCKN